MPQAPEFWARAGFVSDLLAPLGWAYGALGAARHAAARPERVAVPTICVGNLTAGGAGKTPVVLSLAAWLHERGREPHILSRGYGGRLAGPLRVDAARHTASEVGDEPLLLAAAAPTWIGADRIASARAAIAAGADLLLLDDGFQNPALHYDIALVVIDGGYGIGNGRVMPAGPLREPVAQALGRASAVVIIGYDANALAIDAVPVLRARLVTYGQDYDLRRVVAFAGIGRPEKFFETLDIRHASRVKSYAFPDHHMYSEAELVRLHDEARLRDATLITTEKDWVRLSPVWRNRIRTLQVKIEWGDPAALDRLLAPVLVGAHG
jgi:tetraacyldisaccharide 4'-kinase